MGVLSKDQLERGRKLARREQSLAEQNRAMRWEWGDWACDVAPVASEPRDTSNDGSRAKLADGLAELAQVEISDSLPAVGSLRQYREAANAIPASLRDRVRSIEVGRTLAVEVEDKAERIALVEMLAAEHPKRIVTVDAIRAYFDRAMTNTGKAHEAPTADDILALLAGLDSSALDTIADRATAIAIERIEAKRAEHRETSSVGELLEGEDFDPTESWADKYLIRVDRNARLLRHQVERWGFVLGAMSLEEATEHIEAAERDCAEMRAALQERLRDERIER